MGERPGRTGEVEVQIFMYYVYILRSLKNGKYYIGYTSDLNKRIREHNEGKTKGNRFLKPFELIYKEEYQNATSARKREYYIKRQKDRQFIEDLINGGVAQLGERPGRTGEVRG